MAGEGLVWVNRAELQPDGMKKWDVNPSQKVWSSALPQQKTTENTQASSLREKSHQFYMWKSHMLNYHVSTCKSHAPTVNHMWFSQLWIDSSSSLIPQHDAATIRNKCSVRFSWTIFRIKAKVRNGLVFCGGIRVKKGWFFKSLWLQSVYTHRPLY